MIEKEKVIKAAEYAFDVWIDEYCTCSWITEDEVQKAKEDAIAMLKKQIPIAPIKGEHGECPICGHKADHKYCPNCGQAFDWDL